MIQENQKLRSRTTGKDLENFEYHVYQKYAFQEHSGLLHDDP